MSFVNAVDQIPALVGHLRNGLQAMGSNSVLVRPKNRRMCEGSLNLDAIFLLTQRDANRWDYAIGYNGKSYFIEVHPASGQVSEVIAKSIWLRTWLKEEGAPLAAIHGDGVFHWLSTGGVNIIGKERARLAQNKIIINRMKLP